MPMISLNSNILTLNNSAHYVPFRQVASDDVPDFKDRVGSRARADPSLACVVLWLSHLARARLLEVAAGEVPHGALLVLPNT